MKSKTVESITIEKGVPVPDGKYRTNSVLGRIRSAIGEMNTGDSFVVKTDISRPYLAAKQVGAKVTVRKDEQGGWRIWRVQ